MKRYVFMVSDGTGITAENLGNSLITQFENIEFEKLTLPYIDTVEKAEAVVERINICHDEEGVKPLIFMTLINQEVATTINQAKAHVFDLFNTFLGPLEEELQVKSSYTVGRTHGVANLQTYSHRIEAVDYALAHDDGVKTRGYEKADIILIGVSRCGKTPSCLYMALHFGVLAANYPFTDDDLTYFILPEALKPYKKKLFGLTIDPERLQQIRTERRPNSKYASLEQCRLEVSEVEAMYKKENIPYLNSTRFSIEEIATKVLAIAGIKRKF
ncbi:Phosphoenolpyruvate synthase regulatory protein [Legionella massiliensis]|uniref:Putative phosphoenolpyruvate synthase regulatory protein n=1 Tax=Legionella massiliensis TaxID=1034943 RepID=A0A078KXY4_9GAMM|nr:pyruvate, water dikinase regulatory protein [Legionella massiliensis]CDZ79290.1 Phosphoenolpyruvate synthase regulatory protein [Legionella massiliensis]CEE15028.1 Phosphoenolpyruvate synthase regulatory protein [Legionella massiliensis]